MVLAPGVVESRMSVEVWHRVLENLRGDTSPESFANWLEPLEYDRTDSNGVMHLLAPNDNAKSWLEDEFGPRILKAVQTVDVAITTVQLSVQRELAPVSPTLTPVARQQTFQFRDRAARFSPKYTFDSFVVRRRSELVGSDWWAEQRSWYAPELGWLVKFEGKTSDGKIEAWQLIEWRP